MNSRSDPKVIPLSQRIVPASKGAQPQLRGLSSFDNAAEFFLKTIHGIPWKLNKQDRSRAKLICKWFDCMATDDEKAILLDKDPDKQIQRHDISMKLSKLVRARLRSVFDQSAKVEVPSSLLSKPKAKGRYKMITTSAIENRLRDMKKNDLPLPIVTNESFQKWRKQYENDSKTKPIV